MSISSTVRKVGPFVGSGTVSTFPFSFKVFAADDLLVVKADASGTETTLALTTDYTVSLNPNQDTSPGGSVTLVAGALATGYTLIVSTAIPDLQQTTLTNLGGFYPEVVNDALDRLTILVQQQQQQIDRALKYPISDGAAISSSLPIAAQRAGKVLYFAADGSPTLITQNPLGSVLFSGLLSGIANGTNRVFTLTNAGVAFNKAPLQVTVWCNIPLVAGVGFTLGPSLGQVTFAEAPLSTDTLYAQGVY